MCGRFTLRTPASELVRHFLLDAAPDLAPRYNIAPTQPVAAVRRARPGLQRELAMLRWGLVPSWAKDPAIAGRTINARAETVASRPSFRSAFRRRRCLIPADGYYEWQKIGNKKEPYLIRMADDRPFGFAGLWEYWEGSAASRVQGPIESCTIITTAANDLTREIHDRMPVIVRPADYAAWLDPELDDATELQALLRPCHWAAMTVDRVGTHVNSPKNDDPRCIETPRNLF